MPQKTPTSSNKPITDLERTNFVLISKAQLTPIFFKKSAVIYKTNGRLTTLPSKSTRFNRVRSDNANIELKLPPVFSKSSSTTISTLKLGGTSTTRSSIFNRNDNDVAANNKFILPFIISESSSVTTPMHKQNETLVTRSNVSSRNDSYSASNRLQLPPIFSTHGRKAASSVEINTSCSTVTDTTDSDTEQVLIASNNSDGTHSNNAGSKEHSQVSICRHFRLILLLSNDVKATLNFEDAIRELELSIDIINSFTNPEECINFVKKKTDQTIFLIVSNDLGQSTIPYIHDMFQVDTIYILGKSKCKYKRWIKKWIKIQDVYPSIRSICEILKRNIQESRRSSMTISMSSIDLDHLDSSFMTTRALKEILIDMKNDKPAITEFIQFCRQELDANKLHDSKLVDELEQDYEEHKSIWWYTRGCFLYEMINQALRNQEIDVIIKSRFFIRDLQKQIEILYKPATQKLIVYRGQGLSVTDFELLQMKKGGLYSFNAFLSTSIDPKVARSYADSSRQKSESIGVIFQIEVNPDVFTPTQWASVKNESYFFRDEQEVLFAMHSVFRIGKIEKIESRLWQVQLTLTSDDDEELKKITEYIRQQTQGSTGWDRLGKLLLKIGNFNKAEEVFKILIKNTSNDDIDILGHRYHMMGLILKSGKCDYENALIYYDKALDIYRKSPDSNQLDLATIYNNIGEVYKHIENYSKALENFQMALEFQKQLFHRDNSNLAITYCNIAEAHKSLKQYSNALDFYQRVLSIQRKSIPLNVLNLAMTYTSVAEMHYNMKEYSKALILFRKVSRIQQYNSSSNNLDTAYTDNKLGEVHEKMEEYSKALEYYEKALDVISNVSELVITYDNVARTYKYMSEYMKAFEFYQKVLYILERHPHLKQPDLATTHDNIGQIYMNMHKFDKAELSFRQALLISQKSTSQDPAQLQLFREHFAKSYNQVILNRSN